MSSIEPGTLSPEAPKGRSLVHRPFGAPGTMDSMTSMTSMTSPLPPQPVAVRIARPSRSLADAAGFYVDLVGAPQLSKFDDHDGFSGLIVGLPNAALQLEFLLGPAAAPTPTPTDEDLLVLYLADSERMEIAARLESAGHRTVIPTNPYWSGIGALAFRDPDGYLLVLAPP